jgi:hypothetical protein
MFLLRRHEPTFRTIDAAEEQAILDLHKQHPELGRKRLHEALIERGIDVDPFQLKRFLRFHKIGTPPPIGQARPPWGWSHLPHIPWLSRGR